MSKTYRVYEIDGEDLVVASSRKEMIEEWEDYWGDRFRRRSVRVVPPDEPIMMCFSDDETELTPVEAATLAKDGVGYYQARL